MARNIDKDRQEAEKRRKQLIETGFRLFSEEGIENVTLQRVADEAGVGIATLYKYYLNKERLVIAISKSIWREVWQRTLGAYGADGLDRLNACDGIALYADVIIKIYREQPRFLRFSGEYKNFIRTGKTEEKKLEEDLKEHLDELEPMRQLFHRMYERAETDHSIRTDIPEQELFTTVAITMLSVAERYAQGLVWADDHREEHTQKLIYLKEMILAWCAGENTGRKGGE